MPRRRSNLGRHTRRTAAARRVMANQTEEERAVTNEQNRRRMAQVRAEESAEQRAARLQDARMRAQRSRYAASKRSSQQKESNRLRMAKRRQQERDQQSCNYNRLAFRYNPADDYSLSRHTVIGTMTDMFHVVEFLTATPSEYEIVPDIWLSIDDSICVWPPFRSPTMVSKLIQECAKPEEGWKIYQVRSLKRFDTYAAASSCLLKNSGLSNCFPKEESNSRKRQKLNYPKITFQDSDNESSSVTIIPDNPPPENTQNSSNTVSPKVFYIDSLADGQNSLVSDQRQMVQLQSCNDTSAEATGFMHGLLQSQTSAENIDVNINSCTCPLSQSILPLLKNIQKQVEANSRMLQQMLGHEKPPASIIHALPQTFPVSLPVSNYRELKIVDVYLEDDTNFALTIPFFSSLGGSDSKNTLKRILEKLISGELALQMNWKGRGEKEPFHLFSKIHSLIYHAAKRNSKCEDITLMEVEKSIKDWLRFAPERYGGRAKKKDSSQLDISPGPTIVVKIEDP